jgi:hypothetical protein
MARFFLDLQGREKYIRDSGVGAFSDVQDVAVAFFRD